MPIIIGTSVERFGHLMVKTEASPTYYFNLDYESAQTTPIGMKVRVRVSDRDYRDLLSGYIDHPRCEIEEVIGNAADPDVALAAICEAYQLPGDFPEEVIETLDEIPDALSDEKITDCLEHGYRDLRRLPTFTLDGRDAKDFDDAISLELLAGGKRRLWVHIADVAHYVEAYTPLDGEALHRGNSTYLPGQVIPMLPTKLSNGICSLNPCEARLTLSIAITYDERGRLLFSKLYEAVIESDLRADYQSLYEYFEACDNDPIKLESVLPEDYKPHAELFVECKRLAEELREQRLKQGSLNFSFSETKILFDEDMNVSGIEARESNWTHQMIEEFMIAANEQVARLARTKQLKILYRTHAEPDVERLLTLCHIASLQGLSLNCPEHPSPKILSAWIDRFKETAVSELLMSLLLRSLAKARYDALPYGHYGLALRDYCHFTSPIRRYSDLYTHRCLKAYLHNTETSRSPRPADEVADIVSECEIRSQRAERDACKLRCCQYLAGQIGEVFDGEISGFCSMGAFVRLDNSAEGLALFSGLDDYFEYDEMSLVARGQRSHRLMKVGDKLKVRLRNVSIASLQVDFEFLEDALPGETQLFKKKKRKQSADLFALYNNRERSYRQRHQKMLDLPEGEADDVENPHPEVQTLGHALRSDSRHHQRVYPSNGPWYFNREFNEVEDDLENQGDYRGWDDARSEKSFGDKRNFSRRNEGRWGNRKDSEDGRSFRRDDRFGGPGRAKKPYRGHSEDGDERRCGSDDRRRGGDSRYSGENRGYRGRDDRKWRDDRRSGEERRPRRYDDDKRDGGFKKSYRGRGESGYDRGCSGDSKYSGENRGYRGRDDRKWRDNRRSGDERRPKRYGDDKRGDGFKKPYRGRGDSGYDRGRSGDSRYSGEKRGYRGRDDRKWRDDRRSGDERRPRRYDDDKRGDGFKKSYRGRGDSGYDRGRSGDSRHSGDKRGYRGRDDRKWRDHRGDSDRRNKRTHDSDHRNASRRDEGNSDYSQFKSSSSSRGSRYGGSKSRGGSFQRGKSQFKRGGQSNNDGRGRR